MAYGHVEMDPETLRSYSRQIYGHEIWLGKVVTEFTIGISSLDVVFPAVNPKITPDPLPSELWAPNILLTKAQHI